MRADRLVAILLLLQHRGQVTASEVADELEVSERTARRDLDALGVAGLPIYSVQGRNGGWRLAGDGRTDLSGFTASEARALFMVAGSSSAATPQVRAALRKLIRALPEQFRDDAEAASGAIVVDPGTWDRPVGQSQEAPPLLDVVQQAVIEGAQMDLSYVARDGAATTRTIHPLGLATKSGRWYLVAATNDGLRTFRVDRMDSVERTGEPVVRPPDFDLGETWRMIADKVDRLRSPVVARALAAPEVVGLCRMVFGSRLSIGPPEPDGRVPLEIRGHHSSSLAAEIAGFGSRVEVVAPSEVRSELARVGDELRTTYGDFDQSG